MGVICHGQSPKIEKEITRINNPIFFDKKYLNKIILIQKYFRAYFSKKNNSIINQEKIFKELESQKLINFNKILESKSHQYYNELISSKKIIPFEELISKNKKIQTKLNSLKNNSFSFPFHISLSENKIYKGNWSLQKNFNGYGTLYEFNPEKNTDSIIEGIFEQNSLNGFGRIFLSNKEYIIGEFILNKLNGFGEHFRNDGSIYRGGFFDGLPQGEGEEIFLDGTQFKGFYLSGQKKHGKFVWKSGHYYLGDFSEDKFHGYGIYKWGEDRTYEGYWSNGKMDGKGKLKLKDGNYYDGEFKQGKKYGYGIYIWNKEKYYKGNWINDKQNGFGLYYKNGKKIKGFWNDGKLMASYNKIKNNDRFIYTSPKQKNKTLEINKSIKTEEFKNIFMQSGDTDNFQSIKSEYQDTNKKNNKQRVFIPKKVKSKNYFGNAKKIINFDNII